MDERIHAYEIRGVVGRGAMGTVYEAWDPTSDRRVAIKTLSLASSDPDELAEQLQRFEREADIVRNMQHPNIVAVYDSGRTEKEAYLVMEFLDGQSLKELLASGPRLTIPNILWLMSGLLDALAYSHSRGVVHRDIKPANIMVTTEGVVKVADFGVARLEGSNMTRAGMMVGTPAYMSPEQFLAEPVDGRSDIYSAGTVLFQVLTGEKAFEGSLTSITYKVLHSEIPRPSAIAVQAPRAVDAVVMRAMARNPSERFATAEIFLASLTRAINQSSAGEEDTSRTMLLDRTIIAPQAAPASRARLAQLPPHQSSIGPATVEPNEPTRRGAGLLGLLIFLILLAAGCIVLYDLLLSLPLGTMPTSIGLGRLFGYSGR